MEKEEKLPTSFDLQQHSLFPTVPTSAKYATTYKKQQQHVALKHHVTTVWVGGVGRGGGNHRKG